MIDEAQALHASSERAFDGHYQLGSEIAAGERGIVYRGLDEKLDKTVAIKVWHARLGEEAPEREQYDAEARALTTLEHPNIIAITDYGIAGQAPYLIMELLQGETLEEYLRDGPLEQSRVEQLMECVLRALGYMHMRGIVHRNLKPDNVFLHMPDSGDEQVKLLDLGLESLAANSNADAPPRSPGRSGVSVYEAPELGAGHEADVRSDVYAAGVLMLHMITGREPVARALDAWANPESPAPKPIQRATPELEAFLARAVAVDRQQRFANADQMLRALLELPTPWLEAADAEAQGGAAAPAAPAPNVPPELANAALLVTEPYGSGTTIVPADDALQDATAQDLAAVEGLGAVDPALLLARAVRVEPAPAVAVPGAESEDTPSATTQSATRDSAATSADTDSAVTDSIVENLPPIGLVAKLRARKRQLMIGAGAVALLSAGGIFALRASQHEPSSADTQHAQEAAHLVKPAPVKPDRGSVGQSAQGRAAAGAGELAANGELEASSHEAAEHEPSAPAREQTGQKLGEHGAAASSHSPDQPDQAIGPEHGSAAAEGPSADHAAADLGDGAASESASRHASQTAAHEPSGQVERGEQVAAAAPTPEEPARESSAAASAAAAKGVTREPEPPPGATRHVKPNQREIKLMLSLAIAPPRRTAARDPWRVGALPPVLRRMRDSIDRGAPGSPASITTLRRYCVDNPTDIYCHLLLAGIYANRGWSLDALDQYDLAAQIDPSARGAPGMLAHAIRMIVDGVGDADAERFIARTYGREALPAVNGALRARDTSAAGARRLKRLRGRLR